VFFQAFSSDLTSFCQIEFAWLKAKANVKRQKLAKKGNGHAGTGDADAMQWQLSLIGRNGSAFSVCFFPV